MATQRKKQPSVSTPVPTKQPLDAGALRAAWLKRVKTQQLGDGVKGVRDVRVFGVSGDEPVCVPFVESLAVLDNDPVARWAVEEAQRVIRAKQQEKGMQVQLIYPERDESGLPKTRPFGVDEHIDPTQDVRYLVVSRVTGG